MTTDPTAPLSYRTPEQVAEYVDDHLIIALAAADYLLGSRDTAEDHVRDRLAALSDTFPNPESLAAEERRRHDRLVRVVGEGVARRHDTSRHEGT